MKTAQTAPSPARRAALLGTLAAALTLSLLAVGSPAPSPAPARPDGAPTAATARSQRSLQTPSKPDLARPAQRPAGWSASSRGLTAPGVARYPATRATTARGPVDVVTGELFLVMRPHTTPEQLAALADRLGARVRGFRASSGIATLGLDDDTSLDAAMRAARNDSAVRHAGPHVLMRGAGKGGPKGGGKGGSKDSEGFTIGATDQKLVADGDDLHVESSDATLDPAFLALQWSLAHLNLADAVREGISGAGITIAVLDSGVAYADCDEGAETFSMAPDLAHVEFVAPWDFVNDDAHPHDDNGHGTQMTTLMVGVGATLPVAANARIMPVKVLDRDKVGTEQTLVDGIRWAVDHGADVINMSLSFPGGFVPSPALESAIGYATAHGVVLVAATGNDGKDDSTYPARFPEVIAVGAYAPTKFDSHKPEGVAAGYSNVSAAIDVLAPGGSHELDLNEDGYPDALLSMTFAPGGDPNVFGYWFVSGTSAAAAQVSGVAALLLQTGTPAHQVVGRLHESAEGAGRGLNLSEDEGAGAVNAGKSVEEALKGQLATECGRTPVLLNVVGAIVEDDKGKQRAVFTVDMSFDDGSEVDKAQVFGRVRGATDEKVKMKFGRGDDSRRFTLETQAVDPADHPDGLSWQLELEAVIGKVPGCGEWIMRPVLATELDELSYELLSSLGTGLASSALIAVIDPVAFSAFDPKHSYRTGYVETYLGRSFGAGLASSAIISVQDTRFMATQDLFSRSFVFRTFGTGLASSAIIIDQAFFHPAVFAAYQPRTISVRSFSVGSGLASSAIVRGDERVGFDFYADRRDLNPAVMRQNHGEATTAVMVLDQGLLNPALNMAPAGDLALETAAGLQSTGRGTSSTTRLLEFSPQVVEGLGHGWETLAGAYEETTVAAMSAGDPRALTSNYALADLAAWGPGGLPETAVEVDGAFHCTTPIEDPWPAE